MLRRDGAFSSSMVDHVPFVRHVHAATGQAQVRKVDTGQADRRVTSATPSGTSQAWQWRRKTKERKIRRPDGEELQGMMRPAQCPAELIPLPIPMDGSLNPQWRGGRGKGRCPADALHQEWVWLSKRMLAYLGLSCNLPPTPFVWRGKGGSVDAAGFLPSSTWR